MAVSKRLRYEILNRDGNSCTKCGRKPPEVELQVDHVIPVALGGSDTPANLQTLCKDCNAGKSSVPADAPTVDQVSAQALAMADALAIVAEERAVSRDRARKLHQAFLTEWNEWSNWRGEPFDLPGSWKADINQFFRYSDFFLGQKLLRPLKQTRRQAKERLARLDAEAEALLDEAEALIDG